jgi:hypothetical protein
MKVKLLMPQKSSKEETSKSITWQSVREELNLRRTSEGLVDFDGFRREKLHNIEKYTKRPVLVYAVDFLNQQKVMACGGDVSLEHSDLQGFREIIKGISAKKVDVILHSPGGSADAAETLVDILRGNFTEVRFLIPVMAKSAATMLALSGDEILMPLSAELGPIDPQFIIPDGAGGRTMVPAQALVEQFDRAKTDIQTDQKLALVWSPILQIYQPALYEMCQKAIQRSKELVGKWLKAYMFKTDKDKETKANEIVEFLGSHNNFKSHGKRICINDLKKFNVNISDIRKTDPALWGLLEEAWYAIEHTFGNTMAYKLFENSRGNTLVRIIQR